MLRLLKAALVAVCMVASTGGIAQPIANDTPPEKPAIALPSPYLLDGATVVEIICANLTMGSAVYLGSGRYITAAHVVTNEGKNTKPLQCWIEGQTVHISQISRKADWALIRAAHYPPVHATISCDRLVVGETYYSTGFAEGDPWQVTSKLRAMGISSDGSAAIIYPFPFLWAVVAHGTTPDPASFGTGYAAVLAATGAMICAKDIGVAKATANG